SLGTAGALKGAQPNSPYNGDAMMMLAIKAGGFSADQLLTGDAGAAMNDEAIVKAKRDAVVGMGKFGGAAAAIMKSSEAQDLILKYHELPDEARHALGVAMKAGDLETVRKLTGLQNLSPSDIQAAREGLYNAKNGGKKEIEEFIRSSRNENRVAMRDSLKQVAEDVKVAAAGVSGDVKASVEGFGTAALSLANALNSGGTG